MVNSSSKVCSSGVLGIYVRWLAAQLAASGVERAAAVSWSPEGGESRPCAMGPVEAQLLSSFEDFFF